MGKDANIRSVKVNLPKQLPSRLDDVAEGVRGQRLRSQPGVVSGRLEVGTATAVDTDPARSAHRPGVLRPHGGAKFPELVVVLSRRRRDRAAAR